MNTDDYNAFYDMLGHHQTGGLTPLVALIPKNDQYIPKTSCAQSGSEIDEFARKHNGKAQCYMGLNPVRLDIDRMANHLDDDVTHICNILIDVDPEKSDSTISEKEIRKYAATDAEKDKAFKDADVIEDWLIGNDFAYYRDDSGNGNRFIIAIEPIVLTTVNRPKIKELLKAVQYHIQAETEIKIDTSVHDFRRITGIPGTLNLKKETETRKNRMRLPSLPIPERVECPNFRKFIFSLEKETKEPFPKECADMHKGLTRSPDLTDNRVIALCMGAKNAGKFEALWDGDTSAYGGDESCADQALCDLLVFYTQNPKQIDRLFRRSRLYREKWEREDYRDRTIQNAISGLTATYQLHSLKECDVDAIISSLDKTGSSVAKVERAKETFKKLSFLPNSTRKVGCKQIWKVLKLDTMVFKDAYEEVFPSKSSKAEIVEKTDIDTLDVYTDDIISTANYVLDNGLFWDILIKVHDKYHVGDLNIKRLCAVSYATGYITTASGIQLKPSGGSGKGKTHIFDSFVELVPSHMVFRGSMSGMSAYFNDKDDSLRDAMVFLLDDTDLNRTEGLKNTIKRASSNFQKRTRHRTVVKGKGKTVELPARGRWWISSVDGVDDDQLGNRFIPLDVDCTQEQDKLVHKWQKQQHLYGMVPDDDFDVQVCRCCYDILGKETYRIVIPFTEAIQWNNIDNRRNYPMFEDIVMGITFYYIRQRKQVNGVYWATVEDCEKAIEIYKIIAEQNATNLTATETALLKWMGDQFRVCQWIDRNQIQRYTKLSDKGVRDLLHGHDGNGGLLAKFPPLERDRHKSESSSVEKFVYRMIKPFKAYTDVVSLDYIAIDTAIEEYSHLVDGSTSSSSVVLQTTTSFSQTIDTFLSEVVVNDSFLSSKKGDNCNSLLKKNVQSKHSCGKHDFTTTPSKKEANDVENGIVVPTTTILREGTSAYSLWFTPERAMQLSEKVSNWEKANFKITVDTMPRAVFGIARMMRETNLGFIETYLLEYTSSKPVEVFL